MKKVLFTIALAVSIAAASYGLTKVTNSYADTKGADGIVSAL